MLGADTLGTVTLGRSGQTVEWLDDIQTIIEVAFDDGPLQPRTRWTDISDFVHGWTTSRGRTSELEDFPAGTCTVTLDNTDRRFDVDHTTGPYYGRLTYNRPLRIRARFRGVTWPIFHGFVDQWGPVDYDPSHDYTALTITASDAFKLLAGQPLEPVRAWTIGHPVLGRVDDPTVFVAGFPIEFPTERSGVRLRKIATMLGWPASLVDVDQGLTVLRADAPDGQALDYLRRIERSEMGRLFISRTGALRFQARRSWTRDDTERLVQATFSDQPNMVLATVTTAVRSEGWRPRGRWHGLPHFTAADSSWPYIDLDFDPGSRARIRNVINRSNEGTKRNFRAFDEASVAVHGPIEETWDDLLVDDEAELRDAADYRLRRYSTPVPQVTAITVDAGNHPEGLTPLQLSLDIGSRIAVERTVVPGGTANVRACWIEGVAHDKQMYGRLRTTWTCSLVDTAKYWTIGDEQLGQVDNPDIVIAY